MTPRDHHQVYRARMLVKTKTVRALGIIDTNGQINKFLYNPWLTRQTTSYGVGAAQHITVLGCTQSFLRHVLGSNSSCRMLYVNKT